MAGDDEILQIDNRRVHLFQSPSYNLAVTAGQLSKQNIVTCSAIVQTISVKME